MAQADEHLKRISILMTSLTKNKGFLINLKMYIRGVPDSEFFLHMDRILLSLTVRKKSSHFTHSLI